MLKENTERFFCEFFFTHLDFAIAPVRIKRYVSTKPESTSVLL